MDLLAVIDSVEELPEAIRECYEERNGRFVLRVTPADGMALENVDGLKNSLSDERQKRIAAEKSLSQFEGLDPEAAREAQAELEKIRQKGPPDTKAQITRAVQLETEKFQEQLKQATETRDAAVENLKKYIKKADVAAAMAGHGADDILRPHIESFIDVRPNDKGDFESVVLDPQSNNPRLSFDERGNPVSFTVDALVAEMKTQPKWAVGFKAEKTSGSGARTSNGQGNFSAPQQEDGRSPRQRIAAHYEKTTIPR